MHRLVYMKLKAKALQDSTTTNNNNNNKQSQKTSANDQLPLLELSLPDSKSFRASVILPDLSRRFTLLRTNGELLPIDNFRQRLRHELETGHITREDESILINQYQQQFLNQSTPTTQFDYSSPISPSEPHSPGSPKKSSTHNVLFSANTSARDAAYIRKTLKMSNKTLSVANHPKHTSSSNQGSIILDHSTPKNSTIPLDPHDLTGSHQFLNAHPSDPMDESEADEEEDEEDEEEIELTPTQIQRLSLAVDRILDSHLSLKSPGSVQTDSTNQHSSTRAVSSPLDAKFRVHEELFRALPNNSSSSSLSTSSLALSTSQPDPSQENPNSSTTHHPVPSLPPQSRALSITSLTSSEDTLSSLFHPEFRFPEDDGSEDHSSDFEFASELDQLPKPTPFVDRDQVLPFVELTYDEVLFIHQVLVSPPSSHHHTQKQIGTELKKKSALRVDMTSPTPSHTHGTPNFRNLSTSPSLSSMADPHSSLSSQDPMPPILSPRSSALHQRLNLAKAAGIGACHKMRTLRQPSNEIPSPIESSPTGNLNLFPQLTSPSVSDSPDVSSFPLTPPTHHFTRSPALDSSCIPSPPTSAQIVVSESKEARPRNFNSRAGRPLPTTILFRDVEAQAVAANVALHKTEIDGKKALWRKKLVSTAQIGAPKLLSASAEITGIQLEPSGITEGKQQSLAQKTKALSKGTFKLRIKKKRPSESAIHQGEKEDSMVGRRTPMKSFGSIPNLRETNWTVEPHRESAHTRESATGSPTHLFGPSESRDPLSPSASWKNPYALSSFRKLMDRHRKSGSNSAHPPKSEPAPSSPINSTGPSSDRVPSEKTSSSPSRFRRPRTNTRDTDCDADDQSDWGPSFSSKSFAHLSKSHGSTIGYDHSSLLPYPPSDPPTDTQLALATWPLNDEISRPIDKSLTKKISAADSSCSSMVDISGQESTPDTDMSGLVSVTGPVMGDTSQSPNRRPAQPSMDREGSGHGSKWLEVHQAPDYDGRSDYASSILDLYGCDSHHSCEPSPSRSRRSSLSRYSTTFEPSRPPSPVSHGDLAGLPLHPSTSTTSTTTTTTTTSDPSPSDDHQNDNELLHLVHQLQSSTRYSKFDPNPSSLDLTLKSDHDQAFLSQNLPPIPRDLLLNHHHPPPPTTHLNNPSFSPFNLIDSNRTFPLDPLPSHPLSRAKNLDDEDDEAKVWKQILDG